MTKQEQKQKVNDFIVQGYELLDKEFTAPSLFKQKIASLFEVWMNDINIFNERYLKGHPLYPSIHTTFFHHTTQKNSPRLMLGHLEALEKDSDYWQELCTEYKEVQQKRKYERKEKNMAPIIFISHRSTDAEVADMLRDYLVATGIPNEYVFCSSLPGNDVAQSISREVKEKIANSAVNIAILSEEYYKSAYCLNEAGIIWLQEPNIPAIVIGLPEITHTNMYGFLSSDYKLRRLDSATDISAIYDAVRAAVKISYANVSVAVDAGQKLSTRYAKWLDEKVVVTDRKIQNNISSTLLEDVTTDDERVVLYYILSQKVKRINITDIKAWMTENEIYNINIENAFDLLASLGTGVYENDTLNMDISMFRKYTANAEKLLSELKPIVDAHQSLSSIRFVGMWKTGVFSDEDKLFVAYLIENRVVTLGARWMAHGEEEAIHQWELNNCLDGSVASTYSAHLNQFIENHFVYESSWTSYGNVREYALCSSLRKLLLEADFPFTSELQSVMEAHKETLPF